MRRWVALETRETARNIRIKKLKQLNLKPIRANRKIIRNKVSHIISDLNIIIHLKYL